MSVCARDRFSVNRKLATSTQNLAGSAIQNKRKKEPAPIILTIDGVACWNESVSSMATYHISAEMV